MIAAPNRLIRRPDNGWSAQEHAGHLVSVENLWHVRLGEYARGAATLTAADMENRATKESGYDVRPLAAIHELLR